jgi:hypothetical protein
MLSEVVSYLYILEGRIVSLPQTKKFLTLFITYIKQSIHVADLHTEKLFAGLNQ